MATETKEIRILSIDAIRDEMGGWQWNQAYTTGREFPEELLEASNRKILAWMRDHGPLSEASKGKIKVEEYGEFGLEFQVKSTCEPIFAIKVMEEIF